MKKLILLTVLLLSVSVCAQRSGKLKNLYENNKKIGIGTKTPDHLLTVKGTIHTQEVLVDLNGAVAPDYVFETYFEGNSETKPNYKILTLEEIEAYIKEHYHLPKVPSAETMETDGIALKEMNLLLLEKIEELTLFVIQQQQQLDELKDLITKTKE